MEVCVIGAGYVGLVTSACFAFLGNKVVAVEADQNRLATLRAGKLPFYEPGLEGLVKTGVKQGALEFAGELDPAVKAADVIFIAVGTPPLESGEPDLSQVMTVARAIGGALDAEKKRLIVNKSTVPVGSGNWVEMLVTQGLKAVETVPARSARPETPEFEVVSNPEFLREGTAIHDSLYPDRIVVGCADENSVAQMKELYASIIAQDFSPPEVAPRPDGMERVPFLVTDLASAEMIKYSANAFLSLKISFANEIAGICEKVGADIVQVAEGIGLDKRIGNSFLNAGIGWGGSCFGKDVQALIQVAREYHCQTDLLEGSLSVNDRQRLTAITKLQEELKILKGRTIGLMGLSFKPNTDDLRDAPSLTIARQLLKMGAAVRAYDPVSNEVCRLAHPDLEIEYADSLESLARDADALVLVTEWDEFLHADWRKLSELMRQKVLIDGRNFLSDSLVSFYGITYRGVGR